MVKAQNVKTQGRMAEQKKDGRTRMKASTKGTELGRLEDVGIEPYENLANAIIKQAVVDYKAQLHRLLKNPQNTDAMHEAQRIEKFFHSDWYAALTEVNPDRLIDGVRILVRKEAAERERKCILSESRNYRKQAETLRNGKAAPAADGDKELTTEETAERIKELESKAEALKAEAAGKKAEADELERQAIKAVGFLVKEPGRKGRTR